MVLRTPRRSARTWLRAAFNTSHRTIDGWNDLTDRMEPPAGSLHEFARLHTEVRGERLPLLWEAFSQWVRLRGRFDDFWRMRPWRDPPAPSSKLCQPSLAVDDLWQLLAGDDAAWRQLPEHVQVMQRVPARDPHSRSNLYETYEKAYFDEYGSLRLPLLFRVDEDLGLHDGRLYRDECLVEGCKETSAEGYDPEPGRTCMHGIPWVPAPIVSGGGGS